MKTFPVFSDLYSFLLNRAGPIRESKTLCSFPMLQMSLTKDTTVTCLLFPILNNFRHLAIFIPIAGQPVI